MQKGDTQRGHWRKDTAGEDTEGTLGGRHRGEGIITHFYS